MEKAINSNTNRSYKLSILIAQDGLSFCTINQHHKIDDFYKKSFQNNLDPEKILEELDNALKFNFEKALSNKDEYSISAIYANNLYTLVPKEYFKETQLTDYLKFNTKILKTDFVVYDELKEVEANSVYIPYTNINNYLFENFGEFTFTHSSSNFIDFCFKQSKLNTFQEDVYLNISTTTFDICCLKNNKLVLTNTFEYFTPQDFIYFVLFTLEQINFDCETLQLNLSGIITETSYNYQYLYTYIRNISFINTTFFSEKILNLKEKQINPKQNLLLLSNLV